MGELEPIAFDIETTGLDPSAVITVVGLCSDVGSWLGLNTTGREADASRLMADVEHETGSNVRVSVFDTERQLLSGFSEFVDEVIDSDRHYLTAHNGEVWNGGFDLPFLRWACVRSDIEWPFVDVPYADTMNAVQRCYPEPDDIKDLETAYEVLIGADCADPFDDSLEAVAAHEDGEWVPLLLHNLSDIERTRELAVLAGQYVPGKDFKMKNIGPPDL